MRSYLSVLLVLLVLASSLGVAAVAPAAAETTGPTIVSDKADYPPGALVTLTGDGWVAGEAVRIVVNDDQGRTWERTSDVRASDTGNIAESFNLPDWFVATYAVVATGEVSGVARTSFTDGNVKVVTSAPSPVTASMNRKIFSGSTSCATGGGLAQQIEVGPTEVTTGGVGAADSIEFVAPDPVIVNGNAHGFINWTIGPTVVSSTVTACVVGTNGNKTVTANYGAGVPTSISTTTTLTSGNQPSVYGQSVTFTASVSPSPAGAGSVTFKDGTTPLCNVPLQGNTATCTTSALTAGGHSVTAAYSGASGLTSSASAALTQTVNPRPATVTAASATKVYGQADPSIGFTVNPGGLLPGESLTGVSCGIVQSPHRAVGSYTTRCAGSTSVNYAVTYVDGAFTVTGKRVTVIADSASTTYGQADPAIGYVVSGGGLEGDDALAGVSCGIVQSPHQAVGSYTTRCAGSANANYDVDYVDGSFVVEKKQLVVNAEPGSKTYGQADPTLTWDLSGFAYTDDAQSSGITGAPSCSRVPGEGVGRYPITCTPGPLAAANYDFATGEPAELAIRRKTVLVDAVDSGKTYGDGDPVLSPRLRGFVDGEDAGSAGVTGKADCSRESGEIVGSYSITCLPGDFTAENYHFEPGDSGTFVIARRMLAVNAVPTGKTYGDPDPALEAALSGFASGDDASNSGIRGQAVCNRGEGGSVGGYQITCSRGTLEAPNYGFAPGVDALFSIGKRGIEVTATPQTKTYGDADPLLTYEITQGTLVEADAFHGALTRQEGEDVGDYDIEQGDLALSTNYALTFAPAKLAIEPRPLTITAQSRSKIYGEVLSFEGSEFSTNDGGLVNGDTIDSVTLTSEGAAESAQVARAPYGVVVSGAVGARLGNYAIRYVPGELTVNPRALTVRADDQSKTYGEVLSFEGSEFSTNDGGLVNGDTIDSVTLTSPGAAGSASVGEYPVTPSAAEGIGLSNYDIDYALGTLEITARALTVTPTAGQYKLLGGIDPTLVYTITSGNLVNGDVLTGALSRAAGETVGPYAITTGTLSAGPNYRMSVAPGTFSILYRWGGFLQPINDTAHQIDTQLSQFKLGSTVPAKFVLRNAQDQVVVAPSAPTFRATRLGNCGQAPTVTEDPLAASPDSGGTFKWDGAKYQYNWSTKGLTGGLYRVRATLGDGNALTYVDICLAR